jgi:AmmeMemoRadiSam system protein B
VIEDREGFLEAPLEVSRSALLLLALCDGERAVAEVAESFTQRTGQVISVARVEEFVAQMDRVLLLESERFARARHRILEEFQAACWRPAVHEVAYRRDDLDLETSLDGLLAAGRGLAVASPLVGLVAPHIDLHRGGAAYGCAYAALAGREPPEVVVILGTAHAAERGHFILCDKGFATPRGDLPVDREFLDRLERRLPRDHRRDMILHRTEHSIEFQALFLAHLFPGADRPSVVPILCAGLEPCLHEGRSPRELEPVREFLEALRETYREESRKVLVVAGADLGHVGPDFGDPEPVSARRLAALRRRDRAATDGVASGHAGSFFAAVAEHRNRDRICSVAAVYSLLETVEATTGTLLHYDQAVDPQKRQAVSFAAIALFGDRDDRGLVPRR